MSWRPLQRIAWRDVTRHKGRCAVAVTMLTLPVLIVTTIAVLWATGDVDSEEGLDRWMGPEGEAYVSVLGGQVEQGIDPVTSFSVWAEGSAPVDLAEVRDALGDRESVEVQRSWPTVRVGQAPLPAFEISTDLRADLGADLVELTSGRLPRAGDEVAVTADVVAAGAEVGDTVRVDGDEGRVVGVFVDRHFAGPGVLRQLDATQAEPVDVSSLDGELGLVVGGDPVGWDVVEQLNAVGATVYSRSVVTDPSAEAIAADDAINGGYTSLGGNEATVLALIVVMVLIEVVLLAGPAFAVGARRQSRTLALLASGGATPAQVRGVIIGGALVLGSIAVAIGVVGGLIGGAAFFPFADWVTGFEPLADWRARSQPGPYDVPWAMVLAVAGFGIVSALLAAAVPAWLASRADVVAVLAGRRGDPPPARLSPLAGAVLLGVGALMAYAGSLTGDTVAVAASAVVAVLGMVLLMGSLLAVISRRVGRLGFALRYATRDAARQRTRAVPAAAAVAATVAGAVALGIGAASDLAASERAYTPSLPAGLASVTTAGAPIEEVERIVAAQVPQSSITRVEGLVSDESHAWSYLAGDALTSIQGGGFGSPIIVTDDLGPLGEGFDAATRAAAQAELAAGRAVATTNAPDLVGTHGEVTLSQEDWSSETTEILASYEVSALLIEQSDDGALGMALPVSLAASLGLEVEPVGLVLQGPISEDVEEKVADRLALLDGLEGSPYLYVERGWSADLDLVYLLVALGAGAVVLVLVGSLTATALSMNDARADLATLGAVGAPPGTQRRVAAAYSFVITSVGAGFGALVGFVPGLAAAYPLTTNYWYGELVEAPPPIFNIPWLLIGALVVVVPPFVAGVAWATTRVRLPLARRLV